MDDARRVRGGQGIGNLHRVFQRFAKTQPAAAHLARDKTRARVHDLNWYNKKSGLTHGSKV